MDPVTLPAAVVPPVVAEAPSILNMVFGSGLVVQSVLIMLIVLSVWSWAITRQDHTVPQGAEHLGRVCPGLLGFAQLCAH